MLDTIWYKVKVFIRTQSFCPLDYLYWIILYHIASYIYSMLMFAESFQHATDVGAYSEELTLRIQIGSRGLPGLI